MIKTSSIALATAVLLAACAGSPPAPPHGAAEDPEGLTPAFRACYAESKVPWLVAMVVGKDASDAELNEAVHEFVGDDRDKVKTANAHLAAWRSGRVPDAENMAARHFDACMLERQATARNPQRSVRCYEEQYFIFMAQLAKYELKLPLDVATARMLAQSSGDAAVTSAIRRLYRDTYTLTKSLGETGYDEAQFHTCMNIYRYTD